MEINFSEIGEDFEKDAVTFALETKNWRDKYYKELKRSSDVGLALVDMFCCFRCLTTEGGWDTMPDDMKAEMVKYRDYARKVWLKEDKDE